LLEKTLIETVLSERRKKEVAKRRFRRVRAPTEIMLKFYLFSYPYLFLIKRY
jgi:hypothetical protein